MEEHVVHASTEHQVKVGLQLRQACAEMFCQPRERLAAGVGLAADMGCRRGVLEHRVVAVVLTRLARVGAQTLDAELRQSEALNLGDVDSCIAVDEVGGRTVSLVARDGSVLMCPLRPLLGEVLQQQIAQRLAVVLQFLTSHVNI